MVKKQRSTYDTFVASLSAQEKNEFEKEYENILLSEKRIEERQIAARHAQET